MLENASIRDQRPFNFIARARIGRATIGRARIGNLIHGFPPKVLSEQSIIHPKINVN